MSKKKFQVLFICTGNSARSQMSEGLMRKIAGDIADVYSAGVKPAAELNPLAKKMLEEDSIDTSKHYTKKMDIYLSKEFDVVVTTCENAKQNCPVFPGNAKMIHWDLEDPSEVKGSAEKRLKAFRETYADISKRVSELADTLRKVGSSHEIVKKNDIKIEFS